MSQIAKATTKKPEAKIESSVSRAQKTDFSQSINSPVDQILFLQRTIGNQAVQRLIRSGALQTKLRIGKPWDRYEQDADRVADAVMYERGLSYKIADSDNPAFIGGLRADTIVDGECTGVF